MKKPTAPGGMRTVVQAIARFFTRDFALKALSLALALVIYAVLSPDTDTSALQLIRQPLPNHAKNEPRGGEPTPKQREVPPASPNSQTQDKPAAQGKPTQGKPATSLEKPAVKDKPKTSLEKPAVKDEPAANDKPKAIQDEPGKQDVPAAPVITETPTEPAGQATSTNNTATSAIIDTTKTK